MRSGWHWARLKSHQQVGAAGHSAQHGAGSIIRHMFNHIKSYIYIFVFLISDYIPVVPHKAVAEGSRIGNYRTDWLL